METVWENTRSFVLLVVNNALDQSSDLPFLSAADERTKIKLNKNNQQSSTKSLYEKRSPVTEHDKQINKLNPSVDKICTNKNYSNSKIGIEFGETRFTIVKRRPADQSVRRPVRCPHTHVRTLLQVWLKTFLDTRPIVPRRAPETTFQIFFFFLRPNP